MKPVSRARVEQALERRARSDDPERAQPGRRPAGRQPGATTGVRPSEIIPVEHQRGGATRLLDRSTVLYVQAEGDYVRIHADSGRFLVRAALSDIEQRWGAHGFVRVHRSYVANLRRAVEIRPEARRRGDDRDGRRQRGAGRAPPGRGPAPEAADVSPAPSSRAAAAAPRGALAARGAGRGDRPRPRLPARPAARAADALAAGAGRVRRDLRGAADRALPAAGVRARAPARACRSALWIVVVPMLPVFVAIGWLYARRADAARRVLPRAGRALISRCSPSARSRSARSGSGTWGLRFARTTSDLLVASRMVTPWWNAAAISGEYLSAAELPRDRRARDADRRQRAVAVARLHRRLPGAAAVRRGAAAPLRLLHDPRLRRGAAAQPARCGCWRPRSCW